ncbi:MAG: PAS domain-containing protein [Alphaproteobacteria bacterium]|nr:PAS domain-containing protein [Alphaproteobacteria bacterium]
MRRASAASAPRARPAFSIRLLMMLFAAAVTLPLLLYLAVLNAHSFQSARQNVQEDRLHAARKAALDVDGHLAAIRAGIALSAGSTALARGDLASYAAELRLAVRVKGLHGATLLDNTGKVVLGVNLPADPLPDLALLAHGRQGGVSDLVHGHAQGAMLHMSGIAPLPGGQRGLVVFYIAPDIFAGLGNGRVFAQDEILTVRDRTGQLVWRNTPHVVGEANPDAIAQDIAGRDHGVLPNAETPWGGRRTIGFARAPESGFLVTSGVFARNLSDSLPLGPKGTLLLAAVSIGGSFGLAALLGRYLRQAFRRAVLGRTADSVGLAEADALATELRADRDGLLGTLSTVALLELRRLDIGEGLRLHASPSPQFQGFMGVGPEDIESVADIVRMVEVHDRPALGAALSAALADGGSFSQEVHRRHPVHGPRLLRMVGATDIDSNGRIRRLILTLEDITGAQLAASALKEREARFRLALDATGLGLFTIELGSGIVTRSPEFLAMLGRPFNEAEIHKAFDPNELHPDDVETVLTALAEWRQGKRQGSHRTAYRTLHRDGTMRHLDALVSMEHDRDGKPLRLVAAVHDVTEMRRAAQAIQDSEARLRLATEAAGIGIWDYDIKTGVSVWSDNMWTIRGLQPHPGMLSAPMAEQLSIVVPEDRHVLTAIWDRLAAPDEKYDYAYRVRLPSGEIRILRGIGRRLMDAEGAPSRLVGVVADVTEVRTAAQRIKESETRLRLATDAAELGIWDIDLATGERVISPRMWRMFGMEPREGAPARDELLEVVLPADHAILRKAWAQIADGEPEIDYEYRIRLPSREIRHLHGQGRTQRGEDGTKLRITGICADVTERRQAEQALVERSAVLELAVDTADLGVWHRDLDSDTGTMSPRIWTMLGLEPRGGWHTREEFLGAVHPDDRARVERDWVAAPPPEHGVPVEIEFRVQWPDGSVRHLSSRRMLVTAQDGQVRRVVGVHADVTKARRATQALADSEARMRLAVDAADIGVFEYNPTVGNGYWSDRTWRMRGLEPRPTLPSSAETAALVHPEDRESVRRNVQLQADNPDGATNEHEYRIVRADGTIRHVLSRSITQHDLSGALVKVVGINIDITERRRAERLIQRSEARFRLAIETAQLGVWDYDPITAETVWSARMWQMRGLPAVDAPVTIEDIVASTHPQDRARVEEAVRAQRAGLRPGVIDHEYWVVQPDGSERLMRSRSVAIHEASGQLQQIIGVNQDITDQRAAETALRESEARFRLASETSALGVYQVDLPGMTGTWSDLMYTMRGLPPQPGMPPMEAAMAMVHPDDRQAVQAGMMSHRDSAMGEVTEYEFRIIRPDGTVRHLLARAFSVRDAQGVLRKVIGVNQDITEQRAAETALRENEALFRLAIETASLGVYQMNMPDCSGIWSDRMYTMRGLPPRPGMPDVDEMMEMIHPDDREILLANRMAHRTRASGDVSQYEFRVVWPDGSVHHLLARAFPLRAEDGTLIKIVGVNQDITEQKHVEQELRDAATRFELATKAAGLAVWEWQIPSGARHWSPEMWTLRGLPPRIDPPTDSELMSTIHPEDRATLATFLEAVRQDPGTPGECEYRVLLPDGWTSRYINARTAALRDATGKVVRVTGVASDVTERRIATHALQESESLFRLAAEAASQGVWDQDRRTGQVRWSHRMWLIYGLLPRDIPPGRDEWKSLLHPDDRADVLAMFKRLVAHPADHVESAQYRIVWPGGGIRHLEMRAMSVHDEKGTLVRLIGVVVDITEVQELRAQATIAGNVATLGQLAGGIAHELAQPLQAMIATADTAALRLDMSGDADTIGTVRNRLTHISALAARAGKTIQHLLAFSRGTSTSGVTLLSDAVTGTLELVGRNLTHAQVHVSVDVPRDLPLVLGGLVEIEQVLVNLLLNARDAMETQPQRRVEIRARQHGQNVVLTITDTGTGIPPELVSRIFDPFFTTKPAGKGTGLGLAITRKTMVAIGGTIEARNTGTGTEFTLVFPRMELPD